MFPPEMLNKAFGVVEKVGNVRIERIAFAYVDGPKGLGLGKFHIRFTGKANHAWLLEGLKDLNVQTKTEKGPRGETITTLSKPNQDLAIALIGDTDLVLAGYQKDAADHQELIVKMLDIRAGKAQHAGEGSLKMELAKVPAKACGLLVGRVPAEASQGAPFPMPVMINAHLQRVENAIDLQLAVRMTDEQDSQDAGADRQQVPHARDRGAEEASGTTDSHPWPASRHDDPGAGEHADSGRGQHGEAAYAGARANPERRRHVLGAGAAAAAQGRSQVDRQPMATAAVMWPDSSINPKSAVFTPTALRSMLRVAQA